MTDCDGLLNLRNAIVIKAVEDYRKACIYLHTHNNKDTDKYKKYLGDKKSLEMWFRSEYFKFLTNLDGEYVISRTNKLLETCNYSKKNITKVLGEPKYF